MGLYQSHVIHFAVACPLERAVSFLADPRNFPKWAAVEGEMSQIGPLEWRAQTSFGERIVRFSPPNEFGVFDHALYRAGDEPVMMPLRVVANEDGCDLIFVFYRRPNITDEAFASSIDWVTSDFLALRALLEV